MHRERRLRIYGQRRLSMDDRHLVLLFTNGRNGYLQRRYHQTRRHGLN